MDKGKLSTKWQGSNKTIEINVPMVFFEEDNISYAYIPSFDLTGYGHSRDEAEESLKVVLDEFLRYTLSKNTFLIELKRLGWKIKSKSKPLIPPQMSELVNTNEQLREIINQKMYTTSNYKVNMPAFA